MQRWPGGPTSKADKKGPWALRGAFPLTFRTRELRDATDSILVMGAVPFLSWRLSHTLKNRKAGRPLFGVGVHLLFVAGWLP